MELVFYPLCSLDKYNTIFHLVSKVSGMVQGVFYLGPRAYQGAQKADPSGLNLASCPR